MVGGYIVTHRTEKCDYNHKKEQKNLSSYITKMEFPLSSMEERATRSLGGKLALWVFYAFCVYFAWAMLRYMWVIGHIQSIPVAGFESSLGSTSGKWIGALLGFLVLGLVGLILGGIAWYTRPRRQPT